MQRKSKLSSDRNALHGRMSIQSEMIDSLQIEIKYETLFLNEHKINPEINFGISKIIRCIQFYILFDNYHNEFGINDS